MLAWKCLEKANALDSVLHLNRSVKTYDCKSIDMRHVHVPKFREKLKSSNPVEMQHLGNVIQSLNLNISAILGRIPMHAV